MVDDFYTLLQQQGVLKTTKKGSIIDQLVLAPLRQRVSDSLVMRNYDISKGTCGRRSRLTNSSRCEADTEITSRCTDSNHGQGQDIEISS